MKIPKKLTFIKYLTQKHNPKPKTYVKLNAEHQDVIHIIDSSTNSFDETIENGIATIEEGHQGTPRAELDFVSFKVVQPQGSIEDGGSERPVVKMYQEIIDVVGVHKQEH